MLLTAPHGVAGRTEEHHSLVELVGRVAIGDTPAFDQLYDQVANTVFRTVERVLVDPAQAEEVTQEVLFEVWRKAPQFDEERGSVESWIRTIARRRAIDRVRAVTSRREADARGDTSAASTADDHVFDQVDRRLFRRDLQMMLRRLSPVQQEAVSLAFLAGLTHSEIAAALGIPLGTAKTRVRDGLINLRRLMNVTAASG